MWLRGGHPLRLLSLIAPPVERHPSSAGGTLPPPKKLSGEHTTPVLPGAVSTPQEKNLHYALWRGGKLVQAGVNNPSMGVALSLSNPIYQDHYGSPDSEHQEDLYDGDSDHDYSSPSGNEDAEDDDDDFVDIDLPSEDEMRSSFPKNNKPPWNFLIGGPQTTDTTGMTEEQAKKTREADCKRRKKWADAQQNERIKGNPVGSLPRA